MVKLNNAENYESLGLFKIDPEKHPIAFRAKVEELMELCGVSEEEAKNVVLHSEIELELYYSKEYGLFAVEAEAIEGNADIYDPYTGELCQPADDWGTIII